MAGSNLRKFKNPEVLRKFSFQRLLEMVGRYKGYFDRVQFQIDGATEESFDYDGLAAILSNQMFVGEYEELFNGFALHGMLQRRPADFHFEKQLCRRVDGHHVHGGYGSADVSPQP